MGARSVSILVLAFGSYATAAPQPSTTDTDAVLVTVVLHEIAADKPKKDEALCIAIRGGDAEPIVKAVKARHAAAVPNSKCTGGGRDPVTVIGGGKAVRFDVGPVRWVDGVAVVEGGGGHRGGGSIREVEYRVVRDGKGFKVESHRVLRTN